MVYKKFDRQKSEMVSDSEAGDTQDFFTDKSQKKNAWQIFGIAIIIVLIIIVGGYFLGKYGGVNVPFVSPVATGSSSWQAVFLTNGQVYFGKVKSMNRDSIELTNIYYLQVVNKPLQQSETGATANAQAQQELTLIKLGSELHGPTDNMVINRTQVLLTESLKNDSKVVQAINDYVTKQKAAK